MEMHDGERGTWEIPVALAEAPELAPEEVGQVPVALQLASEGGASYQVVAIDAGIGNGWEFSLSVIEDFESDVCLAEGHVAIAEDLLAPCKKGDSVVELIFAVADEHQLGAQVGDALGI